MAQRFAPLVAGALAGVLALGTMAGTARAQDSTHHARTTRRTTTTRKAQTGRQWQKDSTRMRTDTAAYRSMDTRSDTARMRDTVTTTTRMDTTVRTDTTVRSDTAGAHFNRDSAQTSPRATTEKGMPGMQGPPAGAGSPGIVTSADTSGRGANSAGGKPGGPPVTTPRTDSTRTTTAPPR